MARVAAGAVREDTANKTAKRCALLVEMLLNKIRLFFRINFIFIRLCDGHRVTLCINNMEVMTKCDEQVQYALHAKPMFACLLEKYEWVDAQLSSINWRAIGLIKNRLPKDHSIRTTKITHN